MDDVQDAGTQTECLTAVTSGGWKKAWVDHCTCMFGQHLRSRESRSMVPITVSMA